MPHGFRSRFRQLGRVHSVESLVQWVVLQLVRLSHVCPGGVGGVETITGVSSSGFIANLKSAFASEFNFEHNGTIQSSQTLLVKRLLLT